MQSFSLAFSTLRVLNAKNTKGISNCAYMHRCNCWFV